MSWFGDLVDNVKALFSGEKKVFGENVNKKKVVLAPDLKNSSSKQKSAKKNPLVKNNDGTYTAKSSGKTYNSVQHYLESRSYAKKYSWNNFVKNWEKYKDGEISYDELYRYVPSYQREQRIAKQKRYNEEYAEENTSDRGILDRVLGMIGYNGVVEGLYNILDDDPNTTFSSGLKKGLHYMNPFTNDVSQRRSGSDLVKLLEAPDKNPDKFNIEDVLKLGHNFVSVASKANPITVTNKALNPLVKATLGDEVLEKKLEFDKNAKDMVTGLGYDIGLDPLSYVSGGGTVIPRILKGSGYGTDVVKAVKSGESLTKKAQVAEKLRDLSKNNVDKFKEYTKMSSADDFIDAGRATTINADEAAVRQTAERMSRDYNQTIMHMYFDGDVRQGITVGFGNLPFATKKASALRKEILKNDTLKKLGDSTISPYYNDLAKKIRTSRVGKAFSNKNKLTSAALNNEKPTAYFGLIQLRKKFDKVVQDSKIFDEAADIQKLSEGLTAGEMSFLMNAVENNDIKNMRDFYRVRKGMIDRLYKKNDAGQWIYKKTGEIVEHPESIEEVMSRVESSNVLSDVAEANRENRFLRFDLGKQASKYTNDIMNANEYFAFTGKELSKNLDTIELVEDMIGIDKLKNISSYRDLLKNAELSEHEGINRLKKNIIKKLDEDQAKRVALSMDKKKFTQILNDYDSGKILRNYSAAELESMSVSQLYEIEKKLKSTGIENIGYRDGISKKEYADLIEKALRRKIFPKEYADAVKRINRTNDFKKMDAIAEEFHSLPSGKEYDDYFKAPYQKRLSEIDNELSSLSPDIYKDGDFTEEGYRQIFDSLSDEDKIDIAMKYGVASAKGVPLEENFAKMIANQKKIDEFLNSKMYDYLETAEAIINEAENFGREFTEDTPNILSGLRSTSSKIQAAVNLAKKLSLGKHTDEALSSVEKTITEIFVDGMERARVNEIRAGIDPKMEDAMHSHRESYVPHIKAAAKNIVQEDKNGNFVPDFSNTKPLSSHKGRKISGTIADINAEALSNGEAKVFLDAIHEIYTSRMLQSNQYVFAKNTMKYIKENFSAPLGKDGKAAKGFVPGALFNDVNDAFKKMAADEYKRELLRQRICIRNEILNNPKEYLGETYSGNVDRIRKAMNDSDEAFKRSFENYGDDVFRQEEVTSQHFKYKDATEKQLNAAEKLFQKKVRQKTDELASQWEEANRKTFLDEKWQEYKKQLASRSDDEGRFDKFFSPNIVIQKLTDDQIQWLEETFKGTIDLRQYSDSILDRTNIASRTQKAYLTNSMLKLYDRFLNMWKLGNTMFSPAFHVQNALSNAFQSYLGIGADAFNLKKIWKAADVLRLKDKKQTVTLGGKTYSYAQLEHMAKKLGVVNESFAAYDFGKGGKAYWENGARKSTSWQKLRDVDWKKRNIIKTALEYSTVFGTDLEGAQRMNLFMSALDQGYELQDAAAMVDKFLFDYSDLTDFEQNVMKRIVPFYTFMRKNLPMELAQMFSNPNKFTVVDKALTNFEKMDEEGYIDENRRNPWRQNFTQIPFTNKGVNLQLPYYQLERLDPNISNDDEDDGGLPFNKLIGSMSPLIKLFPEAITGEYIYTEMPTNTPQEYAMRQTVPTGLLFDYLGDSETGGIRDSKDFGLNFADISRFTFFPIDYVNDMTVNKKPLYDVETGEYIGGNNKN